MKGFSGIRGRGKSQEADFTRLEVDLYLGSCGAGTSIFKAAIGFMAGSIGWW